MKALFKRLSRIGSTNHNHQLPPQRYTRSKKIKEYGSEENWVWENVMALENMFQLQGNLFHNIATSRSRMHRNINLVRYGHFETTRYNKITEPYTDARNNKDYKLPVELEHYDLISDEIETLKGDAIKRPFDWMVVNRSSDSLNERLAYKQHLINQYVENRFQRALELHKKKDSYVQEKLKNTPTEVTANDGTILRSLEEISRYVNYSYTDSIEEQGNTVLNYIVEKENLEFKFNEAFVDYLCTDSEIFWTGIVNGEPRARRVNPLNFDFLLQEDSPFISDTEATREVSYMSVGQVYDEFYQFLTEENIDTIEELKGQFNVGSQQYDNNFDNNFRQEENTIRVARFTWNSLRKIGVAHNYNDANDTKLVDETYKKKENEVVTWYWLPEKWKATKLADDIIVDAGPVYPNFRGMSNIAKTFSPYVGYRGFYSFVDKLAPYQFLYNVTLFHLKLAMARAKGKGIIIDYHQIPKTKGWDLDKWMYYFNIHNIAIINSREEDAKGRVAQFNQFQQFDLTLGNTINSYIAQLEYYENRITSISNISPQRKGAISSSETVGGVERSIHQSSIGTESLFYIHEEVKKQVLENLLNLSRYAYREGKQAVYITNDLERKVIETTEEFPYQDMGIFISNNNKDKADLQGIKQLFREQYNAQNGEFSDLIKIFRTNSLAHAEHVAEEADRKAKEMQRMTQEQQLQAQKEIEELKAEQKAIENSIKKTELELERYKIDMDNQTKKEVAMINAESKITSFRQDVDPDKNDNGILDVLEHKKLELEREKLNSQERMHEQKMEVEKQKAKIAKQNKNPK